MVKDKTRKKSGSLRTTAFRFFAGTAFLLFAIIQSFSAPLSANAQTYIFVQTSWAGGSTASTLASPTASSTQYSALSNVSAGAGGITLATGTLSTTQTTDTDFNAGTFTGTSVSGSGTSASVLLNSFTPGQPAWVPMTGAPGSFSGSVLDNDMVYPGSGNYIYAMQGYGTSTLLRYSISGNSWTVLTSAPGNMNSNNSLTYDGSGNLYANAGSGSPFYRYSIASSSWTTLTSPTSSINSFIGYPGSGNYLYGAPNASTTFYRYSTQNGTWSTMAPAPGNINTGSSLTYDSSGNYIYVSAGGTNFYRYNISANTWATLAPTPTSATPIIYPGSGNYIYAEAGAGATYAYSIPNGTWSATPLTGLPPLATGASFAGDSSGNYIYATAGNGTNAFYRYSITADTGWSSLSNTPGNINIGSALTYDGSGNYIYANAAGGTNAFYRYSIASSSWATMNSPTSSIYGAFAYPNAGNYIYALAGNSSSTFLRYSVPGNSWATMAAAPGTITGGSLAADNSGNYIYVMAGVGTAFYRYSISANTWATEAVTPGNIYGNNGANLVYPGYGNYMYAAEGNGATFYRYNISANSWTTMAPAPTSFSNGNGTLTSDSSGNYIYGFPGGNTGIFFQYNIAANIWTVMTATPSYVSGGAVVYPGNGGYLYAVAGNSTKNFWEYQLSTFGVPFSFSGATSSWTVPTGVTSITINMSGASGGANGGPAGSSLGTLAVSAGQKYYFAIGGTPTSSGGGLGAPGGYDGGGPLSANDGESGGAGGGMTWFAATSTFSTSTVIEVAGGGAGEGSACGQGGGTVGGSGCGATNGATNATGGTQSSGGAGTHNTYAYDGANGSAGQGGASGDGNSGGGGGGYYGGGGGGTDTETFDSSGAGGSGYVSGALTNATTTLGTGVPSLNNGLVPGVNGYLVISYPQSSYLSPGTYVSAPLNIAASSWGTISWANANGQTISMQARSASTSGGLSAKPWSGCSAIANNGSLTGGGCVVNGDQYIQYQATLSTANSAQTPSLDSVTIGYAGYVASGTLTSQPYNTGDPTNQIGEVDWTEATSTGTGVTVSVSVATSSVGLGASWVNLTDASSSCTISAGTVTCGGAALPASLRSNATWWQYKVTETSTGVNTPTVSNVTVKYVINAPPQFQTSIGGGTGVGVSVTGNSTSTAGQTTFQFSGMDPDASTDGPSGGHASSTVTPSYEYSLNGGATWNPMQSFITSNPTSDISMLPQGSYSPTSTIIWNAKADVGSQYTANAEIAVALSDHQLANATTSATSSAFALDTQAPVASAINMNVSAGTASFNLSDNSNFSYRISGMPFFTSTPTSSLPFVAVGGNATSVSNLAVTFASTSSPMLYLEMMDVYGNDAYQTIAGPWAPAGFAVKDISNKSLGIYQTYLSWASSTIPNFKQYDIYHSTGGSYTPLTTILASSTTSYIDTGLSPTTAYYYEIRAEDTNSNISAFTLPLFITPTGNGGGPSISSVTSTPGDTIAVVSWNTNILPSSSYVYYSQSPSMAAPISIVAAAATSGPPYVNTATLVNLVPSSTNYFYVQSTDAQGNTTIDNNSGVYYSFQETNNQPPIISSPQVTPAQNSATISWTTSKPANSAVFYGTASGHDNTSVSSTIGLTTNPVVLLTDLQASTTYYYYLYSVDSLNHSTTTSESSFATSQYGPIISVVTSTNITKNSATIGWVTNKVANSSLYYSTSTISSSFIGSQLADSTTSHQLALSGLAPSTTYYYYVQATDLAGNITTDNHNSQYYSFVTLPDVTPPLISYITTPTLGQTVATIQWSTDKPASSQVLYGTSTVSYSASTTIANTAPNGVASHSVSLTGLTSATPYYFEVISTDQYGNTGTATSTFTTLTLPGPQITSVATSSVDDFDATITWNTNTDSDSHIYYSTSTSAFSLSAGSGTLVPGSSPYAHSVTLANLVPGNQYYFYVESADQSNNTTIDKNGSLYYSFTTTNAESPVISSPQATNITASSSDIIWSTNKLADSDVMYGTSSGIYPSSTSLLGASSTVLNHSLVLSSLTPSTTYYYVVRSIDSGGNVGTSAEQTFNTLVPAGPQIYNVTIASTSDFGATITWSTNTNSDSHIFYSNTTSTFSLSTGNGALVGGSAPYAHSVTLSGLAPSSTYYFYVQSVDAYQISSINNKNGNYYYFTTSNTQAPGLSNVSVVVNDQTTAGITWSTDKLSNSQVLYGTTSGIYSSSSPVGDTSFVTSPHSIALSGLAPATKYYFIPRSVDAAGNVGTSTEQSFTTLSFNGPKITNVTSVPGDVQATITWNTDLDSNQFVFYGTSTAALDLSAGSSTLVGNPAIVNGEPLYTHSVLLTGLMPSNTYYFYVESTDALGDISADRHSGIYYQFSTSNSQPPILSNFHTTVITGDTAGVAWSTDKLTDSTVLYGTSTQTYYATVTSSTLVTDHEVFLTDLAPNTLYYYVMVSKDSAGNTATSSEQTLMTQYPVFSNVTTTYVDDYSATVNWQTTLDSNSFVYYFDPTDESAGTNSVGTSTPVSGSSPFQHYVSVSGLLPGTTYEYYVESDDTNGLQHVDDNNKHYYLFTTTDHRPPIISTVRTPVIAATSTIVTWVTDKLSTSQVDVGTSTGAYATTTVLDATLVTNHAVTLTGLSAGVTYYYRVRSQSNSVPPSEGVSSEGNFTTVATPSQQIIYEGGGGSIVMSTAPPVISSIASTTTPFNAVVTFNTNESAIGFVSYGTSTNYSNTVSDGTLSTNHSVTISGLVIGTVYHFAVAAIDKYGNTASSTDRTFATQYLTEASLNASSTFVNAYQFQQEIENSIASALPSLVPPFLETPQVTNVKDTSATVIWRTNIDSYSVVYYAADSDYDPTQMNPYTGQSSDITTKVTDHSVTINGLQASTTYHIMAESFSIAGVFGKSPDITFTTKQPNVVVPVITSPQVVNVGDTSAAVTWTTNLNSYSAVYYAADNAYDPTKPNPYTGQTSDVTDKTTNHSLAIGDLQPGTTYHAMAESFTIPGAFATSSDMTFTTNAVGITATVSNVSTTAFRVSWTTNIPTNSIVQYKDLKTGVTQTVLDNTQVTFHNVGVENLIPAEQYQITASGYTSSGNLISASNAPKVATIKDVSKPQISDITIQTIIDPQEPTVAEAIVSWKTDKPATSIVSYGQGVGTSTAALNDTIQDVKSFITNHVVIVPNLTPGGLYQVQISSIDQSGNVGVFPTQTIIVSEQSQSILDVILNNFENTFQFLQQMKQ